MDYMVAVDEMCETAEDEDVRAMLRAVEVVALRYLLMEKCGGLAAVFFPGSEDGILRYIIGSRHVDLRKAGKTLNAGIGGRGGGKPDFAQGGVQDTSQADEVYKTLVESVKNLL